MSAEHTYDVLVVGSGAAGLCAAIAAHDRGLKVLVTEKADVYGGTTAYSAGVAWIPANGMAASLGIKDSAQLALTYLRSEVGPLLDEETAAAFVKNAAVAVEYLLKRTHVRYQVADQWPDYHPTLPGGLNGGRSLSPVEFDGRLLGEDFEKLRPPLRSMMAFGAMGVGRDDLKYVFTMRSSAKSFWYMTKLVARYALDRLAGYSRGTRLVNGNALVGRLRLSLKERGVPLWLGTALTALETEGDAVTGAVLCNGNERIRVNARLGVVLASGGQAASVTYQGDYSHVKAGQKHFSVVPVTNTGDAINAALRVGAAVRRHVHHPAAYAPVSLVPLPDGTMERFPHFIDRGKPGFVAVTPKGTRFVNESLSYHDFVPAMLEATQGLSEAAAFLICDHRTARRFGIGAAPPAPASLKPYLKNGYLKSASSLSELASLCGIDAAALEKTVQKFNQDSRTGVDTEFGRGSDAYQRFNGSTLYNDPNPTLAPIEQGPFYALRLVPGDIGSFTGLRTNGRAQVLRESGEPIPGLYACGNDMSSVMGGTYPGAGITIGPALTFAYLASADLAARARRSPHRPQVAHA